MTNKQIALIAAAIRRTSRPSVGGHVASDVISDATKYYAWLNEVLDPGKQNETRR